MPQNNTLEEIRDYTHELKLLRPSCYCCCYSHLLKCILYDIPKSQLAISSVCVVGGGGLEIVRMVIYRLKTMTEKWEAGSKSQIAFRCHQGQIQSCTLEGAMTLFYSLFHVRSFLMQWFAIGDTTNWDGS